PRSTRCIFIVVAGTSSTILLLFCISLMFLFFLFFFFFFNDTAPTEIYTLSLHDALPILILSSTSVMLRTNRTWNPLWRSRRTIRSEEHTSELQSLRHLVCRLLLEKKKKKGSISRRHSPSELLEGYHLKQSKSLSRCQVC